MTEESDVQTNEEQSQGIDDKRFEVKWRKKSESSSTTAQAASPEAGAATSEDAADLRRQLEEERQRTQELRDRWQRAAADLVNLRRRTEQEQEDREKMASMRLVFELLPVLDNFERALGTIPGNLQLLTWIHGVMLIERQLRAILEFQGVAPIQAQGQPFNAYYHEAISERETSEAAPGTVLQEYQRGYTMHGQVIRPTLVEVARAPTSQTEESPASEPQEPESAEDSDEPAGEEIAEQAETENVGP